MARPKTASKILDARGAFKNHPERRNDAEPVVNVAFPSSPPSFLTENEQACWLEIVDIAPDGVLTGADTITVEMIACLLAEYRKDRDRFPPNKMTRLSAEINRIGLSPSSRAGLTVTKPKGGKFSDL